MSWKICVSILGRDTEEVIFKIDKAKEVADIAEVRIDSMEKFDLKRILKEKNIPILITYRMPEEGGLRKGVKDQERVEVLKEAIELGADYVDIEYEMDKVLRDEIIKNKNRTKIIVSKHFFKPEREETLSEYAKRIFDTGADIGKLIGYAASWNENLIYLNLVEKYKKMGYKLISFAMGEFGRISRIMCPIFGSPWTYAALTEDEKAAPGQIDAGKLRSIWKEIRGED